MMKKETNYMKVIPIGGLILMLASGAGWLVKTWVEERNRRDIRFEERVRTSLQDHAIINQRLLLLEDHSNRLFEEVKEMKEDQKHFFNWTYGRADAADRSARALKENNK